MSEIILPKQELVTCIREQFQAVNHLKYKRALFEFFDDDGRFVGDNVFETTFKLRDGLPPLAYEVSGPYCAATNNYATIGRIYEGGKLIFEQDIKDQIQQRTAAMVWLSLLKIEHKPEKILMVGAGKLAIETVRYLKHFIPTLKAVNYHARNRHARSFEASCSEISVDCHYHKELNLEGYDSIIMATNTSDCLIDNQNIDSVNADAAIVSLCTTSQTGEIAGDVYDRDDINVIFDYDLTRSFTPDMSAADKAGKLRKVSLLTELVSDGKSAAFEQKKKVIRLTGTPMQNVAVLDMLRDA